MTRDTVLTETLASRATSRMVGLFKAITPFTKTENVTGNVTGYSFIVNYHLKFVKQVLK